MGMLKKSRNKTAILLKIKYENIYNLTLKNWVFTKKFIKIKIQENFQKFFFCTLELTYMHYLHNFEVDIQRLGTANKNLVFSVAKMHQIHNFGDLKWNVLEAAPSRFFFSTSVPV